MSGGSRESGAVKAGAQPARRLDRASLSQGGEVINVASWGRLAVARARRHH